MEDIDGGLHPAVDGQSLDEMRWDISLTGYKATKWHHIKESIKKITGEATHVQFHFSLLWLLLEKPIMLCAVLQKFLRIASKQFACWLGLMHMIPDLRGWNIGLHLAVPLSWNHLIGLAVKVSALRVEGLGFLLAPWGFYRLESY